MKYKQELKQIQEINLYNIIAYICGNKHIHIPKIKSAKTFISLLNASILS